MRTSGTVPNFRTPSPESPSRDMWITIALCVFLPPVGLIRLWARARCPLRGKLIISIIAVLSMTLMLSIYISARQPNTYMMQAPPDYGLMLQQTPAPEADPGAENVPVQATPDAQTDPTVDSTEMADPSLIPANPARSL